jgi:multiple sugar transport system substrate-binding protein
MLASVALLFTWLLATPGAASAGALVINANSADPAPRAAWTAAVDQFQRENADIEVQLNIYDHESYKKAIRNWLTGAPPDVLFWFAGYRMRQFAAPGLLEDVSDLFTPELKGALHPSVVEHVSVGGRQFGMPYTMYQVGLYYRRDLLAAAGVTGPIYAWPQLVAACERLRTNGLEPIAIGTKDLWPAAAWFDYLDLRLNGLTFHMQLMQGRVRYTDARLRRVFSHWRQLVDRGCFSRHHASSSWQESQALLYEGKATMMLIGNFIVANFPEAVRDRMDFMAFPVIEAGVGRFEDAPINTIHIPAGARNKSEARRFLAFVARADVQEALNKGMLQLPVHRRAAPAPDRFLVKGRALLGGADGLAQYFDRDTSEDLANVAMKGFQEFMLHPDRLERILGTIEGARGRIYGPLPPGAS